MPTRVKCPSCRIEVDWEGNSFRPFCSERCRKLDLNAWMTERYRIPGEELEDVSEGGDGTGPKTNGGDR